MKPEDRPLILYPDEEPMKVDALERLTLLISGSLIVALLVWVTHLLGIWT